MVLEEEKEETDASSRKKMFNRATQDSIVS